MRFLNQHGFSLIQGMVLASVMAGTALVATKLMVDQKLAQKGAETRDLIEDLHSNVYSVLQHRQHCKMTMAPLLPPVTPNITSPTYNGNTLTLNSIVTDDSQTIIQTGQIYMNNNVRVQSIKLGPWQATGQRDLTIVYERLNSITTIKTNQRGYGAKEISKTLTLRIQKNPSDSSFSACYAVTDAQAAMNGTASNETGNDIAKKMCNEIVTTTGQKAFIWDEANSICVPNIGCAAGTVFTGIDSLGTVKCRPIESWMNLNDILDTTITTCPIGKTVKLEPVVVSGITKIRIICY